MSSVCIIPARCGSVRIPMKNIKLFYGKPILAYSIEVAQKSGIFDRIIVSTDSSMIGTVAELYGAEVIIRSYDLSKNEVGTQEVMASVLESIDCDYACCLYPCAPMLSPETIQVAHDLLKITDNLYIVPVATWLQDPGQFYFGTREAFIRKMPLIGPFTTMIQIPKDTEYDNCLILKFQQSMNLF